MEQNRDEFLNGITTFEEAIKKFEEKEITAHEFSTVSERFGKKIEFWDMKNEPNPRYKDNNKSRVGFKWNPFHSEKGLTYQWVIKKTILAAINFVHKYTLENYDKDQFEYEDERLLHLDAFEKAFVSSRFRDYPQYKEVFMFKMIDIVNGTISKEDIYYRAVYFDFINQLVKEFPNGIELTKEEKENLEKWHKMIR